MGELTSQFFGEAAEDGGGVSVFGGVEGVLSRHSRAQAQHVRQLLKSILEGKVGKNKKKT